jgi:beta-lactamase regulating signal transducer with metallopeptidase domain
VTDLFISSESLFTTGLAVTALLALVLLTRRAVTRRFGARVAYALWLLPVLRLVTPPISLPSDWGISRWYAQAFDKTAEPTPAFVAYYEGADVAPVLASSGPTLSDLWPMGLMAIWLIGIGVGCLWVLIRQRRFARRIHRMSRLPDAALRPEIARAARLSGLKTTPTLRMSLNNDGPLVCGLFRPVIILPINFTQRFTPAQRHLALLHEMTHVRRGDLWTASAMMAFRLALWPNPLVHLAWPRFRADQEAACDAAVLRLTGEAARADYAETLLTAARTATKKSGLATPASATGLTLSLHHPVKERLMTLGTSTNSRRGASRWGLAALLLTGAALTAPLSLADGPPKTDTSETSTTSTTTKKSVHVVRAEFTDDDKPGYEIRSEDGVKTYLRVSRDGTTETLTREQLEAEYDIDVDNLLDIKAPPPPPPHPTRLNGEPGLRALIHTPGETHVRTMLINKSGDGDGGSYEVKVEDGVKQVFRIEDDGTRTEISEDEMGNVPGIETIVIRGSDMFPTSDGEQKLRIFTSNKEMSNWVSDDGKSHSFSFAHGGDGSSVMAESQLRAAQSMLASTDKMLADLRETAEGDAQKDLRSAERELEKALKALEKARTAIEKSSGR